MGIKIIENLKKEVIFQVGKFYSRNINQGVLKGKKIYGNFFINRSAGKGLSKEEQLYASMDLTGKTILEAGAHIGYYTMFFAEKIGNGVIYAFEPNLNSFYFLNKNIKANGLTNVSLYNLGLSNKKTESLYMADKYNSAKGTFKKERHDEILSYSVINISQKIQLTTIDDFVTEKKLSTVDFVKIDTEGFEPEIIEGMTGTMKAFRPLIYFEIHGRDASEKRKALSHIFDIAKLLKYEISSLHSGKPVVTARYISSESRFGAFLAYTKCHSEEMRKLNKLFFCG